MILKNLALQQNLWARRAEEDGALWKSSKERNFPTELANAVHGIRTSSTAPATTTGYREILIFEDEGRIADFASFDSLLLSTKK